MNAARPYRLQVYRRTDKLFDWRILAGNGEIVATSGGQGYERGDKAEEGFRRVWAGIASLATVEVEHLY